MSVSYNPASAAVPSYPFDTAYLSQRDAAVQVPINFVTQPGVSLTAACFSHNRYEDNAAALCFSNLLSIGFRKFEIDLFWDPERLTWSLCPVQIPSSTVARRPSVAASLSTSLGRHTVTIIPGNSTVSLTSPATGSTAASQTTPSHDSVSRMNAKAAQSSTQTAQSRATTVTLKPTTSANSTFLLLPSAAPPNGEEVLYLLGPYVCTASVNLSTLVDVLQAFVGETDTDINFFLTFLNFNVHAAASSLRPIEPASEPNASHLPGTSNLIGNLLNTAFSTQLYTPTILDQQRSNVNKSWVSSTNTLQADTSYLPLERGSNGVATSPGGWPNIGFLALVGDRRIFAGFHRIDPQMSRYNFSGDDAIVFPPGYLENFVEVAEAADDTVTSGCIFDANKFSVSAVNSSWAVTSDIPALSDSELDSPQYNSSLSSVSNITSCGISPFLNQTLAGNTADVDAAPYREFAYSAVWSWAYGEPRNYSQDSNYRCAAFDPSMLGSWRVMNCQQRHHAACRSYYSPYSWTISSSDDSYTASNNNCPDNSSFAVPRTALENRYLLDAYYRSDYIGVSAIWINFNDLDVPTCWVSGVNTTCPYADGSDTESQIIKVPTIAAVVIIVLAGTLILVKCGANRQNSKRKRRGNDGWDYEGVPA